MEYYKKFQPTKKSTPSILEYTMDLPYKDKIIPAEKQNHVFKKYLSNPLQPCTYLLSTKYNSHLLKAAVSEIENAFSKENMVSYTYNIIKNHKTEDERMKQFLVENNNFDALIIDGVFTNTNVNNIDKLRALVSVFEDIPILVLISGDMCGPIFFEDRVFLPFNKFIHFGDIPKRKVREI